MDISWGKAVYAPVAYWIQSIYFMTVFYSLCYLEHVCLLYMKDINATCTVTVWERK
jgi:hypothetical protein